MHPSNKYERRVIEKTKGYRRAKGLQEGWYWTNGNKDEWMYINSRILGNTTKRCSCSMCGNPRREGFDPLTLQELKDHEFVASEFELLDDLRGAA